MIANIRPGILVALRTRIVGGCEYQKQDLEAPAPEGEAAVADVKRWETTRVIEDPVEWAAAKAARTIAQTVIRKVCVRSDFGLLCPEDREVELDAAIETAHAAVDGHNDTAKITRVDVYVLKGRVASTDEEALKGIAAEVRGLLEDMDNGVAAGNVDAVREAASRAKKMGAMLDDETSEKVRAAVAEAREAAREIVKRVVDGEEQLATVLESVTLDAIKTARIAFLDVDEPAADLPLVRKTAAELDAEDLPAPGDRLPAKPAARQVDADEEEVA